MANLNRHQVDDTQQDTLKDIQDKNPSLGWKMILIALFLGLISLALNVSFGYSLGTDQASKLAMAGEYLAFDLAKLVSLGIVGWAWIHHNRVIAIVFSIIFVFTVGFSLISSQAFMAKLLHGQKVERVMNSAAYQDNQKAKARAQDKIEYLAISPVEVKAAQTKVEQLERQRAAAQTIYENYASRGNYPTRTRQAANELNRIEEQLEKQQDIVYQGSAYQGALAHLSTLESKAFTGSPLAGDSGENEGFQSVAFALGVDVKTFIARLLLFMAITSEMVTTFFFFYAGSIMGLRVKKYSHDEIMQMHLQLAEEDQQRASLGMSQVTPQAAPYEAYSPLSDTLGDNPANHSAEESQPDFKAYSQAEESNDVKRITEGEDREIGSKYFCGEKACDNVFLAKTTWQKKCTVCRYASRRKYEKRKEIKETASQDTTQETGQDVSKKDQGSEA